MTPSDDRAGRHPAILSGGRPTAGGSRPGRRVRSSSGPRARQSRIALGDRHPPRQGADRPRPGSPAMGARPPCPGFGYADPAHTRLRLPRRCSDATDSMATPPTSSCTRRRPPTPPASSPRTRRSTPSPAAAKTSLPSGDARADLQRDSEEAERPAAPLRRQSVGRGRVRILGSSSTPLTRWRTSACRTPRCAAGPRPRLVSAPAGRGRLRLHLTGSQCSPARLRPGGRRWQRSPCPP